MVAEHDAQPQIDVFCPRNVRRLLANLKETHQESPSSEYQDLKI